MSGNTILREVISGDESRERLLAGITKSADIISSTLGFHGSLNLFESPGGLPSLTSDGFDSLENLFWSDPVEQIAAMLLREASTKQFETVGDNTSTVCVLVKAFYQYSLDELKKGTSSIDIKNRIDESVKKVVEYIDSIAIPVTEKLMYDIAKTAAHSDDEIASIVTEAFVKAGEFGIVSHKRSHTDETYIDHIAGNPIDAGYANEGFINVNDTQSCVFDNALVLCSLINFQTINEVIPFLDYASELGKPLVIISEMSHDISDVILTNTKNNNYPFCIIKPPYQGKKGRETMADLALVLGCAVLQGISRTKYDGKEQSYLGTCDRIEIGKKDSVITPSETINKEAINGKIKDLTAQIKLQTNEGERNYLRERIAKISGGISTVLVGGITVSEVEEKVARVDDAICAVRASKDGGVVAGGGVALFSALNIDGLDLVTKKTLIAPICKILDNASIKHNLKVNNWFLKLFFRPILTNQYVYFNFGYDVKDYKIVNMFDVGILDTAKGVKNALINAASASNNLLRTNNTITLKRFATDVK